MVHEHWLYHMYGHNPTQSAIRCAVSLVHGSVRYICLGGLDTGFNWHGGQLCVDNHNRFDSLRKDDSMTQRPNQIRRWRGQDQEMHVVAIWNPNEEPDAWIRYRNSRTQQEYTCRLEAFLSRYTPIEE